MLSSKLSSKSQITLPRQLREKLGLKAGDRVVYVLKGSKVVMRKASPIDTAYLDAVASTLTEWNSPEDNEAFRDL